MKQTAVTSRGQLGVSAMCIRYAVLQPFTSFLLLMFNIADVCRWEFDSPWPHPQVSQTK